MVADVGEDVPLDHHLGALGDQQAGHGGVGDLAVGHNHVLQIETQLRLRLRKKIKSDV